MLRHLPHRLPVPTFTWEPSTTASHLKHFLITASHHAVMERNSSPSGNSTALITLRPLLKCRVRAADVAKAAHLDREGTQGCPQGARRRGHRGSWGRWGHPRLRYLTPPVSANLSCESCCNDAGEQNLCVWHKSPMSWEPRAARGPICHLSPSGRARREPVRRSAWQAGLISNPFP